MPSVASVGLTLFCLLQWALSVTTGRDVPDICKRSTIDAGGIGLSSGGALYLSNSDGTFSDTTLTQRWSDFENPSFVAVVVPANENDVINTVKFATKFKIPFLTLGGTHGYSTTLASVQKGIAIDLRKNFKSISVNSGANTVTIGGAVLIQDLVNAAYAAGKQIPTGTCPCVGVLGATLGGGIGRLQGLHGLMADNLLSARVVLASGTAVTASATENKDLYWAIRGAGHNFGVITQATFKVYPQLNGGLHVTADLVFTGDKVEEFFSFINAQTPLPAPLSIFTLFMKFDPTAAPIIFVNIVYAGPEAEGRDIIAQFVAVGAISNTISVVPWNKLSDVAGGGLGNAVCGRGTRKNMFGSGLKKFSPAVMRDVFDTFAKMLDLYPDAATSAITIESFAVQGVQATADSASAYPHRDINNHVLLNMVYTDASIDSNISNYAKAIRSKFESDTGFSTVKTYMNYGHGDESLATLYGQSKLVTLAAAKKKYDPSGVFNAYHALPTKI